MKNKGFLSRSRFGETGRHKGTENPPAALVEVVAAASPPVTEVHVEASPKKLRDATSGRLVTAGSRRHTVLLRVPTQTAARLTRHLEQLPPSQRSAARRALVSAFMRSLPKRFDAQLGLPPPHRCRRSGLIFACPRQDSLTSWQVTQLVRSNRQRPPWRACCRPGLRHSWASSERQDWLGTREALFPSSTGSVTSRRPFTRL
jgi:hypothetical protein